MWLDDPEWAYYLFYVFIGIVILAVTLFVLMLVVGISAFIIFHTALAVAKASVWVARLVAVKARKLKKWFARALSGDTGKPTVS